MPTPSTGTLLKVVKYSLAGFLFVLALWSVVQSFRVPPDESSLRRYQGTVTSTQYRCHRNRDGQESRRRTEFGLAEHGVFTITEDQPGFGVACGLKVGDRLEISVDRWSLLSTTPQVYTLTVNDHPVLAYQQAAEEVKQHRYAGLCPAIILALLGWAALKVSAFGSQDQWKSAQQFSWLRFLLGR